MMVLLFISAMLLFYTYVGYPGLLWALNAVFKRPWLRDERYKPMVSVILPVYNEELVLEKCVRSLLNQEYPRERLEFLIGSDASTDQTNQILRRLAQAHQRIKAFEFRENRGKASVLSDLVAQATGEILFFVDADVQLLRNCITAHAANYVDHEVGAVTGHLAFSIEGSAEAYPSETRYWSMESWIRRLESEIKSTASMYGGNYSMRKVLFDLPVHTPLSDDLYTSLLTLKLNRRIIYDIGAVCIETYSRSVEDEFKRKTRNSSMGLASMKVFWKLLLPWSGWPAFILWPHKVLRWLTPFFLTIALLSSGLLLAQGSTLGSIVFGVLVGGVVFGVCGWALSLRHKSLPVFSQSYWILMMNAAFLNGIKKFVMNTDHASWSPVRKASVAATSTEGAPNS